MQQPQEVELSGEEPRQARNIKYAPLTTPGLKEPWKDSQDNPLSASFIPLDKRGPKGQARWWARFARLSKRPTTGVFD